MITSEMRKMKSNISAKSYSQKRCSEKSQQLQKKTYGSKKLEHQQVPKLMATEEETGMEHP